ncbi:MAG: hypothetical protein RBR00_10790 [Gudongella oleilytica]|nr:hypothetical protein [Gudongella oleilytica]HMM70164.1 hypothetical protein [Gudongella oleilytica]
MIGNKFLYDLYLINDLDTSLNQLMELLKSKDKNFIDSLNTPIDLEVCDEDEIIYLTKASAIIDYYLQVLEIEVPEWLRSEKLEFQSPYFYSKRISDFEKIKLQYTCPAPFKARNVYFEMSGLVRV